MNQKTTLSGLDEQFIDAANSGDLSLVQLLLQAGADVHADDDRALRWSSNSGHLEVVQLLLERGADIHTLNDNPHADGDGALRLASQWSGHIDVVQLLLDKGANIHADDDGSLRMAAQSDHLEVMALLFNQDPDYFSSFIERDSELSVDESLLALVKHYRLGLHPKSNTAPRTRCAL